MEATMRSTTISQYNHAAAQVPDEAILGHLCWFTIREADVNVEKAKANLKALGLSTGNLRPIRAIDAFRLATQELQRAFPARDNVKYNFLVRAVGQDAKSSHRHVVLERVSTRPGERRRLIYDASAEIVYMRGKKARDGSRNGESLQISRRNPPGVKLSPEQQAWLTESLNALPKRFEHLKQHLQSHKVRTFVRDYLYSMLAVGLKSSGGLYFVHRSYKDELGRLGQWVRGIGSEFDEVPLLDLEGKREMIARAWEEEALTEVARLANEINSILGEPSRTIKEATFDEYARIAAELTSKGEEYATMLGIRSELAVAQIDNFKKQVLGLVDRIQ